MILSDRAQRIFQAEDISPEEAARMVKYAAPCSMYDGFNRRHHGWILDIRDGVCHNLRRAGFMTIPKVGSSDYMDEEHDSCSGEGCKECGWVGSIRRFL